MKILVAYYSDTGNTEKVARAIYDSLKDVDKEIFSVKEAPAVDGYDLIFCGFPVKSHSVPGPMAAFVKGLPDGKKVAFFATHGSLRGGHLAITAFHEAITLHNITVVGTFGCRGKVRHAIIEALLSKPEHQAWVDEAQSAQTHPTPEDLEDAKKFAETMVTRARARA